MDVKPFQVKMNPHAHSRLKMRASQLGITIGEMIENLLASFELRLKRSYEEIDSDGRLDSLYEGNTLPRLLLEKDQGDISEEEFNRQLEIVLNMKQEQEWHPKIKLGSFEE